MDNMLEVISLNKNYNDFSLRNINFILPKGKIIGFIGANGSGKSTTIKSILNLIKIDSGNINVFGIPHNKLTKELREKIGVVLDDGFLPEQLNFEDVGLIMRGLYSKWDDNLFYEYIHKFQLPKNKTMKEYSSGMKMKLKLISALCHYPDLLILDEPTSGLDPIARYDVLDILKDFIKDQNHAVLISSHITSDLEDIADDIIFVDNGNIILKKDKNTLMHKYGIIKINKEDVKKIDSSDYLKYLNYKNISLMLVEDKDIFKSKYPNYDIEKPSIENIMLVYMRGGKDEYEY